MGEAQSVRLECDRSPSRRYSSCRPSEPGVEPTTDADIDHAEGAGVRFFEAQEAAGDKRPFETPAMTGSGAPTRLSSATAMPSPMSPRTYQPLYFSSEAAVPGKVGAGGKSMASAAPNDDACGESKSR